MGVPHSIEPSTNEYSFCELKDRGVFMPATSLDSYRLLGRSGLRVSPLALGAMTFGEGMGWGADEAESQRLFDTYADQGGNFIDTANVYTVGASETMVGKFVREKRDRMVIATKYSNCLTPGDPNAAGNHRKNMIHSVEASLKRLNTDYIDLYYLHAWDNGRTPVDEVMRAFDDLVRAGKVLYIGLSDIPAWQASRMQMLADLRGWTPFVAAQIEYSLVERTVEHELIPMAQETGMGVVPWSPLAGGVLTGKYNRDDLSIDPGKLDLFGKSRRDINIAQGKVTQRSLDIADMVRIVAAEIGATPAQVALAWVMAQPGICSTIIGARTATQLEDNLGALKVCLSEEHMMRLSDVSKPAEMWPHSLLSMDYMDFSLSGGTQVSAR
jgi:aryl-alcohol dehydrogenase-like predicted oxidoreductase